MERLRLIGRYEFSIRRKNGKVLHLAGNNLMVDSGKTRAAAVLYGSLTPLGAYLAFGDDDTLPSEDQTDLAGTEVLARTLLTGSVLANIFTQSSTIINAGAPVVVREMGLFSAAAAGTMISRWIPNEFTFGAGDSMEFSWILEVG